MTMACKLLLLALLYQLLWQYATPTLQVDPPAIFIQSSAIVRQSNDGATAIINEVIFSCLQVVWLKDNKVIHASGTRKYKDYGLKKRLLIRNPSEDDMGIYECAFTVNSTERGKAQLLIAPSIIDAPSVQTIQMTANQIIKCSVSVGLRTVEWSLGSVVIASDSTNQNSSFEESHYTVLPDGSLLIRDAQPQNGTYTCTVSNLAGRDSTDITVKIGPGGDTQTTPTDSTINTATTDESEPPGCVEALDISFPGPPPSYPFPPYLSTPPTAPTITAAPWPEVPMPIGRPPLALAPWFTVAPPTCLKTIIGYTIMINCSATGTPDPTISWELKGRVIASSGSISTDGHYTVLNNGSLVISRITRKDRGLYFCVARSAAGWGRAYVDVRVTGEDRLCGKSTISDPTLRTRRIVGGETVASTTDYPWQVLIEYPNRQQSEQICGGVLIRPNWVVTAAHCLFSYPNWIPLEDLRLRVGVYNRSKDEPTQQVLEVDNIYPHPFFSTVYVSANPQYDIALVHLKHPARLTKSVGMVCLPARIQDQVAEGTMCTVSGWGHLQYNSNWSPDVLHKANVPIVSHSTCRSPQSYGNARITRNILCAGYEQGGPDSCQNDSGGPLVCDHEGRWTLYGVVNYGEGCGAPHKYGLYARITRFLKWINAFLDA